MGDINEEFWRFNENLRLEVDKDLSTTTKYQRDITNHVIVYMARGLFSKLCNPFAYFASTGFKSAQLHACTTETAHILESIGFLVRAFVSDGASPRKFYEMMVQGDEDMF